MMMRDERGSIVLNLLLVVVIAAAVVLVVIPKLSADDNGEQTEEKAALSATYQTMRVKAALNPQLLELRAQQWVKVLGKAKQLQAVGVQKGTMPPAVSGKVFLTTRTGRQRQIQAVVKTESGKTCVLTAKGFRPPVLTGC